MIAYDIYYILYTIIYHTMIVYHTIILYHGIACYTILYYNIIYRNTAY